jgi:hypothetical protein
LVGQLISWLVGWSVDQLVGWLVSWLVGQLISWLVSQSVAHTTKMAVLLRFRCSFYCLLASFACAVILLTRQGMSFPQFLMGTHCHVPMDTGTAMMGTRVVDNDKRVIKVRNDRATVVAGSTIDSIGVVEVYIAPNTAHVAFEVNSPHNEVSFVGGHCEHNHRRLRSGTLQFVTPHVQAARNGSMAITIIATWGSGRTVFRSPPFTFFLSNGTLSQGKQVSG